MIIGKLIYVKQSGHAGLHLRDPCMASWVTLKMMSYPQTLSVMQGMYSVMLPSSWLDAAEITLI